MTTGYIPRSDADFVVWFNNFKTKFAAYATSLGFTAADATAVSNDYATLAHVVNAAQIYKTESAARTIYKDTFRNAQPGTPMPDDLSDPVITPPATMSAPGIESRVRAIVGRIKAHPAYTEIIGTDLGIIATSTAPTGTPKPTASASAEPNSVVRIKWTKGAFDGVLVESQRPAEASDQGGGGWKQIGVDTTSPYMDTRSPLVANTPEVRQYRLRYVKADEPTGDYSDILSVTTTP